jgi:hypothetical protein
MIRARPATPEDFLEFYGKLPVRTTRAVVGEKEDGTIAGVAGYYLQGNVAVIYSDYKGGLSKRDEVRGAKIAVDFAKQAGVDLVATQEVDNDIMKHFGFEPEGDIWRLRV